METQKGPYKDYSPFKRGAIWVSMLVAGSVGFSFVLCAVAWLLATASLQQSYKASDSQQQGLAQAIKRTGSRVGGLGFRALGFRENVKLRS